MSNFVVFGFFMNEFLLILTLLLSYGATVLFFKLFGKSGLFVWIGITAIFANIEVMILVHAFGMDQTLGNTLFASSFLATDILSEIYSKKDANRGVIIGIFTTVFFIVISTIWISYIPATTDWAMPSIKTLFARTPRILCASLAGYAISEILDVWLYHKWWNLTIVKSGNGKKFLWFRNNLSTLISQAVNIVLFNFIAFFGIYEIKTLLELTLACYLIYVVTSLLDTPFIYLARKIKRIE